MPYQASTYYRIPGMVMAPSKTVIPGANTTAYVPVKFDQAVNVTTIGFSTGATVSGGKAQCAIYAADPTTRLPTGTPLAYTTTEATAATINNNSSFALNTTWAAAANTLYWIFVIGSTSAVGFNAASSPTMMDEIGGFGMGNEAASGEAVGCLKTTGMTYASTMTWLDFTSVARTTDVAYAPMLWFRTAA